MHVQSSTDIYTSLDANLRQPRMQDWSEIMGYTWQGSDIVALMGEKRKRWWRKRRESGTKNRGKAGTSSRFISRRLTDQKKTWRNESGRVQAHVGSNSDTPPPSGPPPQIKGIPLLLLLSPLPLVASSSQQRGVHPEVCGSKTNVPQLKSPTKPRRPVQPDRWHYQLRHLFKDVGVT